MRVARSAGHSWVVVAVVAGILSGGALLGACSSNSSSTTPGGSASSGGSSTATTRTSPGSTTRTTTSPGSTTSVATGPVRCATTALTAAVAGSTGAAGTIETTVALTSTSGAPCVLSGYPGLLLQTASGSALPTVVVRKGSYSFTAMAPTTVTLTHGGSAYFNIGYSDVPVGTETTCPQSASVQVTPPNAFDHLVMNAALAPCGGGTLVVSPVFLSVGSNSQTTAPPGG
jgi:Protein of unknown function (DUF4232)